MTTPKEASDLLNDLKSSDSIRVQRAIEELTDDLMAHARAKLGSRHNHVNWQEESVVQSVLVRELGEGAGSFENDEHLQGRLRRAVENKIKDRRKGPKGATGQASQSPAGVLADPTRTGPGVGTLVAEKDRARDIESLLTSGLESHDQELVRMCVLNDLGGKAAASRLSITSEAVRQRLSRLRPDLRARLLTPLKDQVSARDWVVLSACLIERMSPARALGLVGCSAEELSDAHERLFRDSLEPALGETGMLALARLLGRAKA